MELGASRERVDQAHGWTLSNGDAVSRLVQSKGEDKSSGPDVQADAPGKNWKFVFKIAEPTVRHLTVGLRYLAWIAVRSSRSGSDGFFD